MKTTKTCVSCGHDDMTFDTRDLSFSHNGRSLLVQSVSGWFCPHCNEAYLEDDGKYASACSKLVQEVIAENAKLVRETRKKLHLTQREAGEFFGGGASAFSEYENGKTQPHKSTLILLKLFNKNPELIQRVR